jgi:hypothetical protein
MSWGGVPISKVPKNLGQCVVLAPCKNRPVLWLENKFSTNFVFSIFAIPYRFQTQNAQKVKISKKYELSSNAKIPSKSQLR